MNYLEKPFDSEGDHEEPPFAVTSENSPQHLFKSPISFSQTDDLSKKPESLMMMKKKKDHFLHNSQISSPPLPGLAESVMTDESSICDDPKVHSGHLTSSSSTFLASSLSTVDLNVNSSTILRNSTFDVNVTGSNASMRESAGFSQLLRAADDRYKMAIVPEHEILDSSTSLRNLKALTPANGYLGHNYGAERSVENWVMSNFLSGERNSKLTNDRDKQTSVYDDSSSTLSTPLLSPNPSLESINHAKASVEALFEDHETFEVSIKVDNPCSVSDVMEVIGNPEYLKLWCDPIQALVVVNSSVKRDEERHGRSELEGANRDREYDGEWIEATTTALDAPPCTVGCFYSAGNLILDTLGLGNYGSITMFVERSRGKVSLTIGPFAGGIHASHTINVFDKNGQTCIVDRVRLQSEQSESSVASLFYGIFKACTGSCFLPPIGSYMEQVKMSMARLRVLVESGELSENVIVTAPI